MKKKNFYEIDSKICVKNIKKGAEFLLFSASSKKISASRAVGISASSSASKLPASSSTSPLRPQIRSLRPKISPPRPKTQPIKT